MAKLDGIIKFTGTINGVNYYCKGGKFYARKAGGGFNREAIKSSPKMKVVRQNNSEFGRVSTTKKHFKKSLEPILSGVNHPNLHRSMMSLFQQIKNCDVDSPRGSRNIFNGLKSEAGQQLLENFHFFPGFSLPGKIKAQLKIEKESGKLCIQDISFSNIDYLLQGYCLHFDFDKLSYELSSAEHLIIRSFEPRKKYEFVLPPQPGDNIWLLKYRELPKKLKSGNEKPSGLGLSVLGWFRM